LYCKLGLNKENKLIFLWTYIWCFVTIFEIEISFNFQSDLYWHQKVKKLVNKAIVFKRKKLKGSRRILFYNVYFFNLFPNFEEKIIFEFSFSFLLLFLFFSNLSSVGWSDPSNGLNPPSLSVCQWILLSFYISDFTESSINLDWLF
jgi:hypothetical protein